MAPPPAAKKEFPWWAAIAGATAIAVALMISASSLYGQIFSIVAQGVIVTIFVTVVGFALAAAVGLAVALMSLADSAFPRHAARLYVEVVRGVPILVLLFWIAFAGVPG